MRKKLQRHLILLFYLVLSVIMYISLKRNVVLNGDDIYFQFQRIMGLSDNFIKDLAPNISISNFGKIGYGVHVFYPWITLIPFRIIYLLTNNWISSYYLGLLFFIFISFGISHYSMKRFTNSTKSALIFSVIYNFSIYRLIDISTRGAVAEYIATIFLPLCFLGFYEVFFGKNNSWKVLAIGMSTIILTHVLTTFMCVIIFALLLIAFSFKLKVTRRKMINLGKAIIATLGATLVYIVPFIMEELFQKYGTPDPQPLKGLDLTKLVYASLINNSQRTATGNVYNVGLTIIIAIVLGVLFFKKFDFRYKAIFISLVGTFLLTTSLVPWHIFQNTPISVIQFPFRFLMFTTLFGSIILTQILEVVFDTSKKANFIVILVVLTLSTGGLWINSIHYSLKDPGLVSPNNVITQKMVRDRTIPDSYLDQYVPVSGHKKLNSVIRHELFVNNEKNIQIPQIKGKNNIFIIKNVEKGDRIDIPFIRYKYTQTRFNNQLIQTSLSRRDSIRFVAPKSAQKVIIELSYGNKGLFIFSLLISIVTWIYLLFSHTLICFIKGEMNN